MLVSVSLRQSWSQKSAFSGKEEVEGSEIRIQWAAGSIKSGGGVEGGWTESSGEADAIMLLLVDSIRVERGTERYREDPCRASTRAQTGHGACSLD